MINIKSACDELNISIKKMHYYMYTKEVKYIVDNNEYYLEDDQYLLLKKIVLLRRLGLSFEDIDSIKVNKNLKKYLIKIDNMIPLGNKYETIKKVIDIMNKDDASFINMDVDKYLSLVNKYMLEGKMFYSFSEDITYEDYKASKFHREYLTMIIILTSFFFIVTLISGGFSTFIAYFPLFFIGLILTFFVFYIPIKNKYRRKINELLRRKDDEKE